MERIRERSLKWLWLPLVFVVPALAVAALFFALAFAGLFINWFCLILAILFSLCAVASLAGAWLYKLYFYYQLSLDVNAVCEGDGVETKSYLFVFAFSTITLGIYKKYWIYKVAQRLQANAPRYGFKMIIGGKEMLALDLFSGGWISAWEFVRNMNRIAAVYNRSGLGKIEGGAA